jgi:hypothetical protein
MNWYLPPTDGLLRAYARSPMAIAPDGSWVYMFDVSDRMSIIRPDPDDVERCVAHLYDSERDAARAKMLGVAQLRWHPLAIRVTVHGTDDEIHEQTRIFAALMLRGMTDGFERPATYAWLDVGRNEKPAEAGEER